MKTGRWTALAAAALMSTSVFGGSVPALASDTSGYDDELTIEVYDVAANYQGEQIGWYAKEIKDRFNIKLNIIAPQVSGDAASLYSTRTASGDLGDIIILDNSDMQDCVDAGLVMDISGEIGNYENLQKYSEQINLFNDDINSALGTTGTWAIPAEMNSNGPTDYKESTVYSMPRLRWDLYQEQGAPDLQNLDDLLDALEAIQTAHPTNDSGDPAYALSLWKDWDGTSIETVNQLTKWYGQEVNGSILIGSDNSVTDLLDKNGAYYKMLKFFRDANERGLVDPDSATQDWNTACDKMKQGRVYLFWYSWQYGFWNSPAKGEEDQNYIGIPLADMNEFQPSDTYYGDGRAWAVGSQVDEEKRDRILAFMDWLASPEGLMLQHVGQEGVTYTVGNDGKYTLTDQGLTRFSESFEVPEEYGGGDWNDGNNQVNQWLVAGIETNPDTGETYSSDYWASFLALNDTKENKEWKEKFGADNEVEYLEKNGQMNPVPSINKALGSDDTDTALMRSECGKQICDTSWRAIFAGSQEEFDQMWDELTETVKGLGWDTLVEYDKAKYQPVIDARKAVEK